jgi:LAO/AO transport system ATPase
MPDDALLERFRRGDRTALARLLSLLARGEPAGPLLTQLGPAEKPARVVAVTGSGGVGKSTLVGKLIERIRAPSPPPLSPEAGARGRGEGVSVAVLACDPQSPLSGGALLGDRFRMPSRPDDDGVFIRSLATPSDGGAIAEHIEPMIRLLERFGFDVILLETVGAGQGDTAVRELADAVVLLLQPETGDDLQWEKAGVLEVADVVVIHKADLPGADRVEAQVRAMLGLANGRATPILRVSAKTGSGIDELWTTLAACPLRRPAMPANGRELLRLAQHVLAERFAAAEAAHDPTLAQLVAQWQQGRLESDEAAVALWQVLATAHRRP